MLPRIHIKLALTAIALVGITADYHCEAPCLAYESKAAGSFPGKLYNQISKRTGPQGDLYGNIAANRRLKTNDVRAVLMLSDILIDKHRNEEDREFAAECIGYLGHQFGIPALLAVMRDKSENEELRVHAVHAICRITDKRAVDHLINMLQDKKLSEEIADRISEQLAIITSRKNRGIRLEKGGIAESAAEWKQWWKRNRKRVKLNRAAAMIGAWP